MPGVGISRTVINGYYTVLILILLLNPGQGQGQGQDPGEDNEVNPEKSAKHKILFYFPWGYSHRQSIEPLANRLSDKGHAVTFLGCDKATRPNPQIAQFCPKYLKTFGETRNDDIVRRLLNWRFFNRYTNLFPSMVIGGIYELEMCEAALTSPDLKPWMETQKFDLVFVDVIYQRCAYALAYKFNNAPTITVSPSHFMGPVSEIWGFPGDYSWAPSLGLMNVFTRERTFFDRLYQAVYAILWKAYDRWISIPRLDRLSREVLEIPDMPSIEQLEKDTSLYFVNFHPANDHPRSLPPFMVEIGGMHCDMWDKSKGQLTQIPKEMEDFIDGAGDDGFIFMSLGSMSQMSYFPEETINLFFDAIRGRETRVLWKWDVDPPQHLPENVLTSTWFPQQSLLAHPKIKGFISHGGMMSYQQSSCYGVPIVIIPSFFDQPYNGLNAHLIHQTGIHLELADMTREKLSQAIDSILLDKRYLENAKRVKKHFMDRPLPPLDLAEYWAEYVMRHRNGSSHLKPTLAMNQFWWQRHQLDVWLFILITSILSLWLFLKMAGISAKVLSCIRSVRAKSSKRRLKQS